MGTWGARAAGSDSDSEAIYQQRFTQLAEMSSDGICVHQDGRIVFANAAAIRWMGVDPHVGLIGRRVAEFVHPDSYAEVLGRLRTLRCDGGSAPRAEVVMGRPRKPARNVQATSMRIDWNGCPAIMTTFRDLTTAKAAAVLRCQAALLDHVSDAVIGVSVSGVVTSWNAAAEKIYHRAAEEVLHLPVVEAVGAPLDPAHVLRRGGVLHTTHVAADGSPLSVRVSAAATDTGHVLVCADLTALRRAERHFEAVVTALDAGVVVFNPDGSLDSANPTARRIADGITESTAPFAADVAFVDADGRPIDPEHNPMRQAVQSGTPQLDRIVGVERADGRRVWLSVSTRLLGPHHPGHSPVLFSFVDVTAQKLASEQLAHAAHHDTLTGLPNRSSALARMSASLAPDAKNRVCAVLFIDMDNLKLVNDSHGHSAGDAVLTATATRMGDVLRDGDVIARLAGDEFIVLVFAPIDRPGIDRLVDALHRAAAKPIRYRGADILVTASIGVTVVEPDDARDALDLLRAADEAMYAAKTSGRGLTGYAR